MEGRGGSRATTVEAVIISFIEVSLQGVASSNKPSNTQP